MLELLPATYTYALYSLMILSVSSFFFVVYSLRDSELPVASIKLFQLYFAVGMIGWLLNGIRTLTSQPVNLNLSSLAYFICGFILLLAVVECARNRRTTWLIAFLHILVAAGTMLLSDDKNKLLLVSAYALLIYPVILFFSAKRAIHLKNIGNAIIGFSALIVILCVPFQIYALLISDIQNLAYSVAFIASAAGYVLVGIGFLTSILINEHKLLTSLALKDPLTGLLNRRGLDYSLRVVLASAKRNRSCISVIAIDIDHFKKINDQYGHDGGDLVLQDIAEIISSSPRETDVCCRLGGEEFVIVLADTAIENTLMLAERMRALIEETVITSGTYSIKLTASFGVATECTDVDIDRLLKNADKALYQAKHEGRNCVRKVSVE